MPDTATVETPAPAAAPELETTGLTDEALKAVFAEPADVDDIEETPAAEVPTVDAPAIDLSLLKDDSAEAATPAPQAAPDDPYVKMVRTYLPDEGSINMVVGGFQRDTALSKAIDAGDFQGVVNTLGPDRVETLFESIYRHDGLRNAIIDRAIAEATGQKADPEVKALKKQLAEVQNYLHRGEQERTTAAEHAEKTRQFASVNSAIDDFFTTVKFPNDSRHAIQREMIRKATLADLATSGKLPDALKGNKAVIRAAFKPLLTQFVESDKPATLAADKARTTLETKQRPVATGAAGTAAVSADEELNVFQRAANEVARIQKQRDRRR